MSQLTTPQAVEAGSSTASPSLSLYRRTRLPQCGDLLFYDGGGDLASRLVRWWTHGPFAHVAVALSATECVQALSGGIVRSAIPLGYSLAPTGALLDASRADEARDWLLAQVGNRYGFADILDDVLARLLARLWPSHGLLLVEPHAFDCSDLAARFLAAAGYPLPADALELPEIVTPNSLAHVLDVLPSAAA